MITNTSYVIVRVGCFILEASSTRINVFVTSKPTKSKNKNSLTEKNFIRKPHYEGGSKAIQKFIADNLVYPESAIQQGVQGSVQVDYDVNENGMVVGTRVMRSVSAECDAEAVRLVKLLRYTSAKNRGLRSIFHFHIVINFVLQKSAVVEQIPQNTVQTQQAATQLVYSYVSNSSVGIEGQETQQQQPVQASYSYTVQAFIPQKK